MSYTLLKGSFVIRYPDLPRQGPEPDGDTVKFRPDTPALVETLARVSGRAPDLNARGISVRLEALDALETHFGETHQELGGANAARDALLAALGFTNVEYFPDQPNKVRSADQDSVRGHVLSNGIDANGRLIGFVYAGDADPVDGSVLFLETPQLDQSVNARLLADGHAYPAFYATLPAELRAHLAVTSREARTASRGIWATSTADPNGAATVTDLASLETLAIWPKLFRRLVPYLAAGFPDFDGFDAWLRADPVNRDDEVLLLSTAERSNLHDVVTASGSRVQLTVWPDDFVISPDPARPGVPTGPQPGVPGDVLIVAALPDPLGTDRGHESVTLLNISSAAVELDGWALVDTAGGRYELSGSLDAGGTLQATLDGALALGNNGDTITLVASKGMTIDQVTYKADEVRPGRTVCFGR
ncbi:lamin tail domain-containing protein [Cryptosporangium aurantiacum]|uniref:Nuclease homologue n=1 Tax=Cryptosporangium aurantiacum TaxID=134849 RepID=A0A1M7RIQ7_9ACTN|nr:lamin tail domain-containing protein [Cryptosporangium aurantiacum]SHN46205.1 nuclease homologue [Cryptosporangium aurantiacum]